MSAAVPIDEIRVDPQGGDVRGLRCGDREIPLVGGGCEFGDWFGYFSQQKCGGSRCEIVAARIDAQPKCVRGEFDVRLPRGEYRLRFRDELMDGALHRDYTLVSLGEGALGDFVLRTAALAEDWPEGRIAGEAHRHAARNFMHQHPVRAAALLGAGLRLDFELTEVSAPQRLGVYTYLRDARSGEWVMHHRLLTERGASDELVFRFRHTVRSSAQSAWVRWLERPLWRAAERKSWIRPTIQVGGIIRTRPDEEWTLRSVIRVRRETEAGS